FALMIHLFVESGYPFQHIRYWYPHPRFLLSRISSTSYSSCPSIRLGGGCAKLGPWEAIS
ncbi:hypothetical protein HETIRDRAFT_323786, partial [Heterobasidion irregulare TC 32-1]